MRHDGKRHRGGSCWHCRRPLSRLWAGMRWYAAGDVWLCIERCWAYAMLLEEGGP